MAKVEWYGDEAIAYVRSAAGKNVERAARDLRDFARKQLSGSQPTAWLQGDQLWDFLRFYKSLGPAGAYELVKRMPAGGGPRTKVGLDPSKADEWPKLVTGHLRRNVQAAQEREGLWRVGTNVLYGRYLELGTRRMARRPWLSQAIAQRMATTRRILGGLV